MITNIVLLCRQVVKYVQTERPKKNNNKKYDIDKWICKQWIVLYIRGFLLCVVVKVYMYLGITLAFVSFCFLFVWWLSSLTFYKRWAMMLKMLIYDYLNTKLRDRNYTYEHVILNIQPKVYNKFNVMMKFHLLIIIISFKLRLLSRYTYFQQFITSFSSF